MRKLIESVGEGDKEEFLETIRLGLTAIVLHGLASSQINSSVSPDELASRAVKTADLTLEKLMPGQTKR